MTGDKRGLFVFQEECEGIPCPKFSYQNDKHHHRFIVGLCCLMGLGFEHNPSITYFCTNT